MKDGFQLYLYLWYVCFSIGSFIIIELLYILFIGWEPYAYFRELEESHSSTQVANAVNGCNVQTMEAQPQVDNAHDERSIHGCMGLTLARNSNTAFEEMETGRR